MSTVIISTFPENAAVAPMGNPPARSSAYAQSFVAPGGPLGTIMQSMKFRIMLTSANVTNVKAYVYQWDSTNRKLIGPALFASPQFTISNPALTFYTIPVNVFLTSGLQYVAFFSVLDNITGTVIPGNVAPYSTQWSFRGGDVYTGGKYYFNNSVSFASYSVGPWGQFGSNDDLAFEFVFQNILCIHPEMKCEMYDGSIKSVADVKVGDLLKTANDNFPSIVMENHRNPVKHKRLVKIDTGSISDNIPTEPLLLASTHPIVIDGIYIPAKKLINKSTIRKIKCPVNTHVLITDLGLPVMINGCAVGTWNQDKWQKGIDVTKIRPKLIKK